MRVRVTQLDGKMPNLACMRLAAYWRGRGADVVYSRTAQRGLFEGDYDLVYGSAIFAFSADKVAVFRRNFPDAIIGGTGIDVSTTLEDVLPDISEPVDYADQDVTYSLGFLQRGCRLRCKFCVVPQKEGRPRLNQSVAELWRGDGWPRHLHVLDNDFFGIPEWREHVADMREGGYRVCLSQGINVRLIDDEAAEALASIDYRNGKFGDRRIYTAWDNLGQERIFFAGVERLNRAGIPNRHIMAYMLTGFAPGETMSDVEYRFSRITERGIFAYPMVYDIRRKDLRRFQRWAISGLHRSVPFSEYCTSRSLRRRNNDLQVRMEF